MGTRKAGFRGVEGRSSAIQNYVVSTRVDGASNIISMNFVFDVVVVTKRNYSIDEVRRNVFIESILEGFL